MAINNFIPTIWSARIQANLRNNLVYGQDLVVNRDYEGEIRERGDTVKITSIGSVEIGDYSKNTDFTSGAQVLDDASGVLTIDKARYYNFFLDDVDRTQGNPRVMDETMGEAAFALANDADKYIAAKIVAEAGNSATGTGSANILGTDATPFTVGMAGADKNAYEQLVNVSVALDEANVPPSGRYAIVPAWFYGLLLKDNRFVNYGTAQNRETLANGEIGAAAGLRVLRSNSVPTALSGTRHKIIGGHRIATTFANQLSKTEAYRPERRFGDAMKGLNLYGGKVTRPSAAIVLTVAKGTL